jgi:hypothetical protein
LVSLISQGIASALIPWHHSVMPSRASKDRDFVTVAGRVVEHAIGEHLDGTPLEDPDAGKNPAALALTWLRYFFSTTTSAACIPRCACTPAMEAGISNDVWVIKELCGLLPESASATKRIDKGLILKALGERVS